MGEIPPPSGSPPDPVSLPWKPFGPVMVMICGSCAGQDHQCDHDGCACPRCNPDRISIMRNSPHMFQRQPNPVANTNPAIQDLVVADMAARKALGIQRYGTALQAGNGRDALRDLYEELLDGCNYARQMLFERDGK